MKVTFNPNKKESSYSWWWIQIQKFGVVIPLLYLHNSIPKVSREKLETNMSNNKAWLYFFMKNKT